MKSKAVRWDQYFDLPNYGLKAYFYSVEKGNDVVYYGAFNDVHSLRDVQHVLKQWSKTLWHIKAEYPQLLQFELDMLSKVGPMSVRKPLSARSDDIKAYFDDIKVRAIPIKSEALDLVLKEFSAIRGLNVRSQKRTIENMRLSTNSGSPYFTSRKKCLDETLPIFSINVKSNSYYLDHVKWYYCAILGWRGQEGGPSEQDVKQRVVWMFPFGINVRELQVYQPLIESCQRYQLVAPWMSMDDVDQRITMLFDTKGVDDLVICTDFTKFDQHFNEYLVAGAYYLLSKILAPNKSSAEWLEQVFPVKYEIPIAVSWGKVIFGHHGMGSGSGGTNADETLVHRALQHESAYAHNAVLNPYSMCLGDDGVLSWNGISTEKVLDVYTSHGLEMNESKQYASKDDCVFLRRWHSANYRKDGICVGVYSTYRALGRLMYRERMHKDWDEKKEALRTLSILENCKYHPLAEQFAHFVMVRDRYHLGKDIPGFLDSLDAIVKENADSMNDYLSYTQTIGQQEVGINNWWIVKYVRSH